MTALLNTQVLGMQRAVHPRIVLGPEGQSTWDTAHPFCPREDLGEQAVQSVR